MRALGGHPDSVNFLSQIRLTVTKTTDTIMFDASADQTDSLTDWMYLGTLYSGGECELLVTLEVPVTLDNQFKNLVGYLDWEFAVEELPVEEDDPVPETGDQMNLWFWIGIMALSFLGVLFLLVILKRKKQQSNESI